MADYFHHDNANEIAAIKYYLDEFERKDIKRYTVSTDSAAPSIITLMELYTTLRQLHVYFRLKTSNEIDCRRTVPVGIILLNFFSKHIYANKKEFEIRYPCISQMISVATGRTSFVETGGEMTSVLSTE